MNNFYAIWEGLDARYRTEGDVVFFIPLVGYYGFRHSEIVKVYPKKVNQSCLVVNGSRTYEKCTNGDLAELQSAIDMGIGQLILHPYYLGNDPVLLMYGTGRTGTNPNYTRVVDEIKRVKS